MRIERNSIIAIVLLMLLSILAYGSSNGKHRPSNAQAALRLPIIDGRRFGYHGSPRALSEVDVEGYPGHGQFLGTDAHANIYIEDRCSPDHVQLRCYNSQGKIQKSWKPLSLSDGGICQLSVDGSGKIWVGLGFSGHGCPGLPIMAYDRQHWEPVLDWSDEAPKHVNDVLNRFLLKNNWTQQGDWTPFLVNASKAQVVYELYGPSIPNDGRFMRCIGLIIDGSNYNATVVNVRTHESLSSGPNGSIRHLLNDSDIKVMPIWNKVTYWQGAEASGNPPSRPRIILDRASMPTAMLRKANQQSQSVPDTQFDDVDDVYVIWSRQLPSSYWTYSLDVLSREGRILYSSAWTKPLDSIDPWVAPIPDGSGFYQATDDGAQLTINFVPLNLNRHPKAK